MRITFQTIETILFFGFLGGFALIIGALVMDLLRGKRK
jgi:hypothetical protein